MTKPYRLKNTEKIFTINENADESIGDIYSKEELGKSIHCHF